MAGRRLDTVGSRVTLKWHRHTARDRTENEQLAVLAEQFDLHFPAGTRFGAPGVPWPA